MEGLVCICLICFYPGKFSEEGIGGVVTMSHAATPQKTYRGANFQNVALGKDFNWDIRFCIKSKKILKSLTLRGAVT